MKSTRRCRRIFAVGAALLALGFVLPAPGAEPGVRSARFNHHETGFPLTGAHNLARCDTCHSRGVFRGTPHVCAACHIRGSGRATTYKTANHVPTNQACDQCHDTRRFAGARFDHSTVAPGSCDLCHRGGMARAKPARHMVTTASCDACHSTRAFRPATFDHSGVAPGTCMTCHNGSNATGKPANHVLTTASCDACHRTSAWRPAGYDHTSVAPGTCMTCHNGSTATGKNSGHFVTTRSCDVCHTTTRWTPTTTYAHTSPLFPGPHNSSVTCRSCHTSNSEVVVWPFPAYQPDCAGCHASRFRPDPHKKTEVPTTIFYSVSELRNCAGSCHIYTDNTFTTILRQRSGEHRSNAGGF